MRSMQYSVVSWFLLYPACLAHKAIKMRVLNDADRGNRHTGRKTCHSVPFFHLKFHVDWSRIEPRPRVVASARLSYRKRHFRSQVHTLPIKTAFILHREHNPSAL